MQQHTALIVLGVITALVPHAGFPGMWKTGIITVCGALTAGVAYMLRRAHVDANVSEPAIESVLPEPETKEDLSE
jgi:hypothetical protein